VGQHRRTVSCKLRGEDLSRSNKTESVALRKCPYCHYFTKKVENSKRFAELAPQMAENSWHRYDMKKLHHCHPMYSHQRQTSIRYMYENPIPRVYLLCKAAVPCQNKIILKNFSVLF